MNSILVTSIFIIFCLFSQTTRAQYFELLQRKMMKLTDHVESTKKGAVYIVSVSGINYISNIESHNIPTVNTEFKNVNFEKVKWEGGLRLIDTKVEAENLVILGSVNELKTNSIVILKYTFNPQLHLINEEEVARIQRDKKEYFHFSALQNDENTCSALLLYSKIDLEKNSSSSILKIRVISFNDEMQNNGIVEYQKEISRYMDWMDIVKSAILLKNGGIIFNIKQKLFLCQKENNALTPFDLEIEMTIYSYKFFAGSNGGLILIGGYTDKQTSGMAILEINSSGDLVNQEYLPLTSKFNKEFYELTKESNSNSDSKSPKQENFLTIRPSLVDATIEDDGTIRAVFMGIARDKNNSAFRNNFVIIGEKDGVLLYQYVVPYIYKEDAYVSVGSTAICVFFNENSTTLCYQDYQQNYDDALNFLPTTQAIPFMNKPLYASVRFYYDSEKTFHKMLDVKPNPGIDYKKNASYMNITNVVLPDNSILIGCDEWGVASIKESYLGRLVIP
jgi:hypothetical protein